MPIQQLPFFALLLFLAMILIQIVAAVADMLLVSGSVAAALLAEYALNLTFLLIMTVWFNYCLVQQNGLFGVAPEDK